MNTTESSARVRAKRRNWKRTILTVLEKVSLLEQGIQGRTIFSAIRANTALQLDRGDQSAIARAKRQMIMSRLVYEEDGILRISKRGREELQRMKARALLTAASPRQWDGRWRLLIFDIPESKKSIRERLRGTLTQVGFIRLQDSVWMYPYDCEDFIALLKLDLKMGKEMLYAIVDELEGSKGLKKQFGLR